MTIANSCARSSIDRASDYGVSATERCANQRNPRSAASVNLGIRRCSVKRFRGLISVRILRAPKAL